MDHRDILGGIFSPGSFLADREICSTRHGLLAAPMLAALSLALSDEAARAGTINPSETEVTLPGAIKWGGWIAVHRRTAARWRRSTVAWTSPAWGELRITCLLSSTRPQPLKR
jgi:hypothetical protein